MSTVRQRAVERLRKAMDAYMGPAIDCRNSEELITDLLADLMHYAADLKAEGLVDLDFETLLKSAWRHYYAETEDDAKPEVGQSLKSTAD